MEDLKGYKDVFYDAVCGDFRELVCFMNTKLPQEHRINGWAVGHTSLDGLYIVISSVEKELEPFSADAVVCREEITTLVGSDLADFGKKYPIEGICFLPTFYLEGQLAKLHDLLE